MRGVQRGVLQESVAAHFEVGACHIIYMILCKNNVCTKKSNCTLTFAVKRNVKFPV